MPRKRTGYDAACYYDGKLLGRCTRADSEAYCTRGALGNSAAMLLMIGLMLPFFFFAMYEKDGLPLEKVLKNIIRTCFLYPRVRPYKTENFYALLSEKEAKPIAETDKRRKARSKKA